MMIKPPFTLLILKSPHRPVAIRISTPFFLLVFIVFPILCGASGYALSLLFPPGVHGRISASAAAPSRTDTGSRGLSATRPGSSAPRPEISGLFVSSARGGGVDVAFSLSNTVPGEKYYLWIVANPDAAETNSAGIYPRSPVFRGLPVDYRNGISYDRSQGGEVSVTFGEGEERITVEKLRILVYAADGKILTDKQFTVGQNTRSSSP